MREAGCDRVVMAGKIRRPSLAQLKPDAAAASGAGCRPWRCALRSISSFFAEVGIETLSPDSSMPQAVMPSGVMSGALNEAAEEDIRRGIAVLEALGGHDVGQGVVIQDARVIAVEAAEGTDEMLRRVAPLLDPAAPPAVFVKRRKSGQDARLDMPVIGADTLRIAAAGGVSILALETNGVLLAGAPEDLWALASSLELTVVGL